MDDNNNLVDKNERILKAIAYLKGKRIIKNQKDISDRGLIANSNLSRAVNGDAKYLTDNFLERFADEFNLSKEWFLTGEGSMLSSERDTPKKSFSSGRPFYDADWELGFKASFEEATANPDFNIDFPPANAMNGVWMRGRGKSMLGEIDPGDYIYFVELRDFSWLPYGRIYGIVTRNGMRTVKRLAKSDSEGHYRLISCNPDKESYPDQDIPIDMIERVYEVRFVIKDLNE